MKKNKHDDGKKDRPIRVVGYMRVGTISQLSPEEQEKYLALHPEEHQEGEKNNADSDS